MATVIETLIIELGLDARKFTKGRRDALASLVEFMNASTKQQRLDFDKQKQKDREEDKLQKDQQRRNKQVAESYKQIRNEVVRMGAELIAAAGIANMIKSTISLDANVGRLSGRLNVGVRELSMWEGAVQMVGGSTQDADQSIANLTNTLQQYLVTGASPLIGVMRTLHMTMTDLAQGPTHSLLRMNEAVQGMNKATATFLLGQMGMSGPMISLIEGPRKALQDYLHKADELGNITKADADRAEEAKTAMAEFGRVMTRITNDLLARFLPGLSSAVEEFSQLAAEGAGIKAFTDDVGDLVNAVVRLGESSKPGGGLNMFGQAFMTILTVTGRLLDSQIRVISNLLVALRSLGSGDWKGAWGALQAAGGAAGEMLPAFPGGGQDYQNIWAGAQGRGSNFGGMMGNIAGGGDPNDTMIGGGHAGGYRGQVGGPGPNISSSELQQVENFFKQHGASAEVAHGIAAGIVAEGGGVNVRNPKSGAMDIGQWLGDRQKSLISMYGPNPSLSQQLAFMLYEMTHKESGAGGFIRNAGSTGQAAYEYITKYMRPAKGYETDRDIRAASGWLGIDSSSYMAQANAAGVGGESGTRYVSIGTIVIDTKATNAREIAKDLHGELVAQGNRGLQ